MPHLFVDYMKPKFLSIENKKILIFLCHFIFFFVYLQRHSIKRTYAECAEGMVEVAVLAANDITNFTSWNHKLIRKTYHDKEKKSNNLHDSNHDYAILAPG